MTKLEKVKKCFFSRQGSALIIIVLMFAMLLVLGTGAGIVAASSSHNSIRETKKEQAYIAARSVALAIKDEIISSDNPDTLVADLNNVNSIDADFLEDTAYDLNISELSEDSFMFTVTAVTASATETYSFVMNKTEGANPQVMAALTFMLAHTVTGALDEPVYGSIYLDDIGDKDNNTVVLKADIYGSLFVNSPKNGNTLVLENGSINGDVDFLNEPKVLGLVTGADTLLKIPVIGDVYVDGDIELQGNGKIDGDLYINGSTTPASLAKSQVTGTVYEIDSEVHEHFDLWNEHIGLLEFYSEKGNIMEAPDWAIKDIDIDDYEFIDIPNSNDTFTITDSYKLDVNYLSNHGPKSVLIDATGKPDGLDIILTEDKNKPNSITLKDVVIKTRGKVNFYLPDGVDLNFENNGSIVTETPNPAVLSNYLIGLGQNDIHLSSGRGSLYAFVYIRPQGNNTGWGSGSFRIEGGPLQDYEKLYGSVYASDIHLNPDSGSVIRYGGVDAFDSGDYGSTTTSWDYAGVTSSE